ncbi:unnamed protein product [Cuscuta campestris]|uniref:RNase H type-1 domain-containing protein n=1 Tax=Cuscuta campestris TaxID=132261 RepID=A0A484NLS4_9ASTE|nr:unnamed protein product [Cuscuta campestris]
MISDGLRSKFVWIRGRLHTFGATFISSKPSLTVSPFSIFTVKVEAFQRGWTNAAASLKGGSSVVVTQPISAVTGEELCFVDATVFPQSGLVCFGCVLLGEDSSFRAAVNGRLICVQEPLMAEAMACCEALLWLKGKGIRAFKLFSDCLQLVTAIEQRDHGSFSSYLARSASTHRSMWDDTHPKLIVDLLVN